MVVDDSAQSRRALVEVLSGQADVSVVGTAGDGEEALRDVATLRPDVLCLDLEMPRMDGFTFLRLLMARSPTPVIVVSSYARKADVFKALELGALDFVAKQPKGPPEVFRDELLEKVRMVRNLRLGVLERRAHEADVSNVASAPERQAEMRLLVVGASTGGPPALTRVLSALPGDLPLTIAIAQHMPEKFTKAFAERLGKSTAFAVAEAEDGEPLVPGRVILAPGGRHLAIEQVRGELRAMLRRPTAGDSHRYCPSVDLLFESAAQEMGDRTLAVVLTGMGNDGRRGVAAVKQAGGRTIAESEQTAVVFGMPKEAIASGKVDEVLRLEDIAEAVVDFGRAFY
jgi:two-component system chemotaxis response regulator CheB